MVTIYARVDLCSFLKETPRVLEKASKVDAGLRLAELEHPSLKNYFLLFETGPDLCLSPFLLVV